eukprot:170745_1
MSRTAKNRPQILCYLIVISLLVALLVYEIYFNNTTAIVYELQSTSSLNTFNKHHCTCNSLYTMLLQLNNGNCTSNNTYIWIMLIGDSNSRHSFTSFYTLLKTQINLNKDINILSMNHIMKQKFFQLKENNEFPNELSTNDGDERFIDDELFITIQKYFIRISFRFLMNLYPSN